MKKINDKDLLLIVGGATTLSGTILNQLNKLISILVDSGKSLGSSIGSAAATTATNVGSSVATAAKEHSELAGLKAEINVIEKELDASYVMIGRKYVEYVIESGEMPSIDITDILKMIDPKMTRKQELQEKVIELEKRIKEQDALRDKQAAEAEYIAGKEKLDKALAMGVLDQADYDVKLSALQKKRDNFEIMRKLEQQVQMGIITEEEKNAKLFEILN